MFHSRKRTVPKTPKVGDRGSIHSPSPSPASQHAQRSWAEDDMEVDDDRSSPLPLWAQGAGATYSGADATLFTPDYPSVLHLCSFLVEQAAPPRFDYLTPAERELIGWLQERFAQRHVDWDYVYDRIIPGRAREDLERAWNDCSLDFSLMVHRFQVVQQADVTKAPLMALVVFLADWLKHYDGLAVRPSFRVARAPENMADLPDDALSDERGLGLFVHDFRLATARVMDKEAHFRLGGLVHGPMPVSAGVVARGNDAYGSHVVAVPGTTDTYVDAERFFTLGEKLRWANWPDAGAAAHMEYRADWETGSRPSIYAVPTWAWEELELMAMGEVLVAPVPPSVPPGGGALMGAHVSTTDSCVNYIFNLAQEAQTAPLVTSAMHEPRVLDEDCAGLLQTAVTRVAPLDELPWESHAQMTQAIRVERGTGQLTAAATKDDARYQSKLMRAGDAVVIPRGTWHSMRNVSVTHELCLSTYYAKNAGDKWEHKL